MSEKGAARADYQGVEVEHLPNDRCLVRVKLGRKLSASLHQSFVGKAEGEWSPMTELRCAAEAALLALERSFGLEESTFTLVDVKTVESFDCPAVITAVRARHGGVPQRLVGFCEVGNDPNEASAKSALNATNRYVWYHFVR